MVTKYPLLVQEMNEDGKRITKYLESSTINCYELNLQIIKQKYHIGEENTKHLSALMIEFFQFYVNIFDSKYEQINIRADGFIKKYVADNFPFSIVDPFDDNKNPGDSVRFGTEQHAKILHEFKKMAN